jgi:hypothetical protein
MPQVRNRLQQNCRSVLVGGAFGEQSPCKEQFMTWGEDINNAIARRDTTALRGMAEKTQREETQVFLKLLAGMIDRHLTQGVQLKKSA